MISKAIHIVLLVVKRRLEPFQDSEMTVGRVPALGNFKILIFHISKPGLVPINITYENDAHHD